jgi:hypothetical protein
MNASTCNKLALAVTDEVSVPLHYVNNTPQQHLLPHALPPHPDAAVISDTVQECYVLRAAIELLEAGAAAVQHINRRAAAALREVRV